MSFLQGKVTDDPTGSNRPFSRNLRRRKHWPAPSNRLELCYVRFSSSPASHGLCLSPGAHLSKASTWVVVKDRSLCAQVWSLRDLWGAHIASWFPIAGQQGQGECTAPGHRQDQPDALSGRIRFTFLVSEQVSASVLVFYGSHSQLP